MLPRGIYGVFAMGRPARPREEIEAVAAAAKDIMAETGITAAEPLGREIARRVVAELLADLARDPFEAALAAIERQGCPIARLATCPVIDAAAVIIEQQVDRLRARGGRDLSDHERKAEWRHIATETEELLARRYGRHLRSAG